MNRHYSKYRNGTFIYKVCCTRDTPEKNMMFWEEVLFSLKNGDDLNGSM